MVEQRQKVDSSLSPTAPVPVTIPTPVEVCGEAGAGDPVLVEGIAGGVPVPVEGTMGGFPVAVGGVVEVQNPAPMGLPIPLLVQDVGGGGVSGVPTVPNFPSITKWSAVLPSDGSWATLICGTLFPPYNFRDLHAAGDVPEYSGNYLPKPWFAYYNPEAGSVIEIEVTEEYRVPNLVRSEVHTYVGTALSGDETLVLDSGMHTPSWVAEGIYHYIQIRARFASAVSKDGYVDAILFSHYGIDGGMPS